MWNLKGYFIEGDRRMVTTRKLEEMWGGKDKELLINVY
jgi:hypothetical protein